MTGGDRIPHPRTKTHRIELFGEVEKEVCVCVCVQGGRGRALLSRPLPRFRRRVRSVEYRGRLEGNRLVRVRV